MCSESFCLDKKWREGEKKGDQKRTHYKGAVGEGTIFDQIDVL